MNFTRKETEGVRFENQLIIEVSLGLPCVIMVVCRSASRNSTSWEIFDQNQDSMGWNAVRCDFGPALGEFNYSLIENLNVLLDEFGVQVAVEEFLPVSKLAVEKCESRYGHGVEDGDCIITIH